MQRKHTHTHRPRGHLCPASGAETRSVSSFRPQPATRVTQIFFFFFCPEHCEKCCDYGCGGVSDTLRPSQRTSKHRTPRLPRTPSTFFSCMSPVPRRVSSPRGLGYPSPRFISSTRRTASRTYQALDDQDVPRERVSRRGEGASLPDTMATHEPALCGVLPEFPRSARETQTLLELCVHGSGVPPPGFEYGIRLLLSYNLEQMMPRPLGGPRLHQPSQAGKLESLVGCGEDPVGSVLAQCLGHGRTLSQTSPLTADDSHGNSESYTIVPTSRMRKLR